MRKLKILGVGLVAVVAMSAVAASAASAAEFHSEIEKATLKGEQVEFEGHFDRFTVNAGTTECKTASYSGTTTAKVSPTQTITPAYSNCSVEPIGSAVVKMNECDYFFHSAGTVDIQCPTGHNIEVVASALGSVKCTIHIGAQTGINGVTYSTKESGGKKHIHVDVNSTNIKYWQVAGSGFGACKSEGSEASPLTNGKYRGTATIKGFEGASQKNISFE